MTRLLVLALALSDQPESLDRWSVPAESCSVTIQIEQHHSSGERVSKCNHASVHHPHRLMRLVLALVIQAIEKRRTLRLANAMLAGSFDFNLWMSELNNARDE